MSEHREKDTMQRLAAFTSSLRSKPVASGGAALAADASGAQAAVSPPDIEEVSPAVALSEKPPILLQRTERAAGDHD